VFLTTWLSGGISYSFGVFLPILMEDFNETREKAGKLIIVSLLRRHLSLSLSIYHNISMAMGFLWQRAERD
jgi:hypothetical protein